MIQFQWSPKTDSNEYLISPELKSNAFLFQLPPGLTICKNDLGGIAGQFLKLVDYNKEVFGEFYNEIIANHCLFKVEAWVQTPCYQRILCQNSYFFSKIGCDDQLFFVICTAYIYQCIAHYTNINMNISQLWFSPSVFLVS